MHLVHAGASILSNGKPSGSGVHLTSAAPQEPSGRYGQGVAAGFSHSLKESTGRTGGVTVLTSSASGPLSLTPPLIEPEKAMKEGPLASPSSSEWQEFWDEEVEASYYYNCVTREALWVRPDGF